MADRLHLEQLVFDIRHIMARCPELSPKAVTLAIEAALEAARCSPCAKSKRGVAAFRPDGARITSACNGPPWPFRCDGSEACRAACSKVAVHAEERALRGRVVVGEHVIHLKVVDGQPLPSGDPSCVTCSRSMIEQNVGMVWLWQADGWRGWTAKDFHSATLRGLGLPMPEERPCDHPAIIDMAPPVCAVCKKVLGEVSHA